MAQMISAKESGIPACLPTADIAREIMASATYWQKELAQAFADIITARAKNGNRYANIYKVISEDRCKWLIEALTANGFKATYNVDLAGGIHFQIEW